MHCNSDSLLLYAHGPGLSPIRARFGRWARVKDPRCLDTGESAEKFEELMSVSFELLLAKRGPEGVRRDADEKYFPETEDVMEQPALDGQPVLGSAWRRIEEGVPGVDDCPP